VVIFSPPAIKKNTVQCNLSKSNIHGISNREKAGTYRLMKLFGQLNHSQFNLRNKFKNSKISLAHLLI